MKFKFSITVRQIYFAVLFIPLSNVLADQGLSIVSYEPSNSEIPENTLRVHLTFSAPMMRGQVRHKIKLINENSDEIKNPFLNLNTELWDSEQKRLTLIFDPGRIKQKVGPNIQAGAPLMAGQKYSLLIDKSMTDINGMFIKKNHSINYSIVAPENRILTTDKWIITQPVVNTKKSLKIKFDRLIDAKSSMRLIKIVNKNQNTVSGDIKIRGKTWYFNPAVKWDLGKYEILIHPDLEDVSGNNFHAPFNAPFGSKDKKIGVQIIQFRASE